ncbi:hypothetical protein CQ046_09265 [Chryseobacterium sp. MYb7]|uniref:glycosyltransferase family 2 protein n=1 Tax=Chryseobacterium sp. MYb7 TaxID=1827290 RepID=UPI000CFEC74A|nr:glycosyltransferase family 2 protein [Chryseobacterium sp. MYb7]PRB03552.1 hypothetical protein CQ046_09265 [Chryseobacterium sp. MYb7]
MTLDVIIPFYNVKEHILDVFEQNIKQIVKDGKIKNFNIILVNDGSSTFIHGRHIENLQNTFPDILEYVDLEKNIGKGGAIKKGMEKSRAEYAIFYDIDFPFGMNALYDMYNRLNQEDIDLIIAKRDFSYYDKLPWKRKFISIIVKLIAFVFSKGTIHDSQAGLKGMKKKVIPILLETHSNSFIMDFEFLLKASRRKIKMSNIIVTPNEDIEFTNFSNQVLRNEIKGLLRILISKIS